MGPLLQKPEPPTHEVQAIIFKALFYAKRPVPFRELYIHDPLRSLEIFRGCCYMEDQGWIEKAWNGARIHYRLSEYGRDWVAFSLFIRDGGGIEYPGDAEMLALNSGEDHGDVSTHLTVSCGGVDGHADQIEALRSSKLRSGHAGHLTAACDAPSGYQAPPAGIQLASVSGHSASEETLGNGASSSGGSGAPETMVERVERIQGPTIQDRADAFKKFMADWPTLKGEAR